MRDADEQILRFNSNGELIWVDGETRFSGYIADGQVITADRVCDACSDNHRVARRIAELAGAPQLAFTLLCLSRGARIVWKLKRKTTNSDEARIKRLEDRLDAAVAESQRMRRELENLQRRDHPAQSSQLARPKRRHGTTRWDTYNPDDTVN